jgi:hypothetical protein
MTDDPPLHWSRHSPHMTEDEKSWVGECGGDKETGGSREWVRREGEGRDENGGKGGKEGAGCERDASDSTCSFHERTRQRSGPALESRSVMTHPTTSRQTQPDRSNSTSRQPERKSHLFIEESILPASVVLPYPFAISQQVFRARRRPYRLSVCSS